MVTVAGLLLADHATAFLPQAPMSKRYYNSDSSRRFMAVDMPPAAPATTTTNNNLPVIQANGYAPAEVRYSDFLRLVNGDRIEKVTFSADGSQMLGVDVDGTRFKIEALPNDPELLTQLTDHKVSPTKCYLLN